MRYAYNLNLSEIVTVDEMLEFHHELIVRHHRYICLYCRTVVSPVISMTGEKENHFKHIDGSKDLVCEEYYGGGEGVYFPTSQFRGLYHPRTEDLLRFVGFRPFSLEEAGLSRFEELLNTPIKYHPNLFCGNFLLWIKDMDNIMNTSEAKIVAEKVHIFSKYRKPVFFVLNKLFNPKENRPNHIIEILINGSKGVVFEVPENSSISVKKIKLWIINSEGIIENPGRISLEYLIKEGRFSYRKLRKLMKEIKRLTKMDEEHLEHDHKHTYKDSMSKRINCSFCHYNHSLLIAVNEYEQVEVYRPMARSRTFRKDKLGRIFCRQGSCNHQIYSDQKANDDWADHQVERKRKQREELIEIIQNTVDKDEKPIELEEVIILLGEHEGKIGKIIDIEGSTLIINLNDNNEIVEVPDDFVLDLINKD